MIDVFLLFAQAYHFLLPLAITGMLISKFLNNRALELEIKRLKERILEKGFRVTSGNKKEIEDAARKSLSDSVIDERELIAFTELLVLTYARDSSDFKSLIRSAVKAKNHDFLSIIYLAGLMADDEYKKIHNQSRDTWIEKFPWASLGALVNTSFLKKLESGLFLSVAVIIMNEISEAGRPMGVYRLSDKTTRERFKLEPRDEINRIYPNTGQ